MFLKYLQIVNYKNLKSTRFSFVEGVNTVIGENDSGKSNAMTALRILLDDTYYYNTKRLKENDFSDSLENWKGHWIILSAVFGKITSEDKKTEVCAGIVPENEDEEFLKSYIKSGEDDIGVISLFIRPQKHVRKKLSEITDTAEFEKERRKIKISDYEFYYTSRAQTDFTNNDIYAKIVGDLENGKCSNPDEDDDSILGCKLNIADVQDHISVVFIDALRDVASELGKPKNPIRRIIESVESLIKESELDTIKSEIVQLNISISKVEQVELVGRKINEKLLDMIGMVYSPEIILQSGLKDDINSLSRYLFMKPSKQNDIDSLGLGHLNMIYIALKIVEYEINRTRELINIMIIEEPEAHIHTHIQRTLFDKLKVTKDYTQIITTTHSTHLAEVSEVKNINIMKSISSNSISMQPSQGLDEFGKQNLKLKNLKLSDCIERYLDSKRSVLLFSKGVVLVEGDGEEILIPNIIKKTLGVSLDEIGIGLINVGSVSFEYIASLFGNERIRRKCAIITDEDVQIVEKESTFYKAEAEERGQKRKDKLTKLYGTNPWVKSFFAPHTLEVDFALADTRANSDYISNVIELNYVDTDTVERHKKNLKSGTEAKCANTILTLAGNMGKGWYATTLSNYIDNATTIPKYILEAIAFASKEVISLDIILKMIEYSLSKYDGNTVIDLKKENKEIKTNDEKNEIIKKFKSEYENDVVTKFLREVEKYCKD
ncbi:AAA family ATPase [Clostridium ammoniilyticum]|jgi:putative ATP-dependent endonuclease of OLD family|uniref:AAA family ATPase n=1 Tax=[Clostridium] ammoniilyticum TaxID=2981784 RepID=A0ABT2SVW4_9FIRM|nr:AAA family ATPase [[Clostridium] ammoniilyticum]MCU6738974.1 AAA family ATPase [[Clostridium] ammoniilyticum]SCH94601.1 recombination protein F [uncultured Clostridium sp.]